MEQEFKPGQIVPQSGIYRITHDPQHADMPHEVTAIKGRRFPTRRRSKGIAFVLVQAAHHMDDVDQLADHASYQDVNASSSRGWDRRGRPATVMRSSLRLTAGKQGQKQLI